MADLLKGKNKKTLLDAHSLNLSGGTWRLFVFALFVFSVMMVGYLGLKFGYKNFVQGEINALDTEIEQLVETVLPEEQDRFIKFFFQLTNIQDILNNHIVTSQFFPLLQDNTNQLVVYQSLKASVADESIQIAGIADSYEVLAQQLNAFEKVPEVEQVSIRSASLGENGVRFDMNLQMTRNFFK
jgi:hypothetical protein